mgnify:CR=1 FL=1
MNFNLGGNYPQNAMCETKQAGPLESPIRPRTLREQLQDRIAGHNAQIANLQEACDALTPDVEKALNALQKL